MKKRVLFLCIGNSCRSQMAEAFAKAYGKDILEPSSAGLAPASGIAALTKKVLADRNLSIDDHYPKDFAEFDPKNLDLVVNMSGQRLPAKLGVPVVDWTVRDPIGQKESVFQGVAQEIENKVMRLILDLRLQSSGKSAARI